MYDLTHLSFVAKVAKDIIQVLQYILLLALRSSVRRKFNDAIISLSLSHFFFLISKTLHIIMLLSSLAMTLIFTGRSLAATCYGGQGNHSDIDVSHTLSC